MLRSKFLSKVSAAIKFTKSDAMLQILVKIVHVWDLVTIAGREKNLESIHSKDKSHKYLIFDLKFF